MKFKDRIKQFGFRNTLKSTFFYLARFVVHYNSYLVLAINNHFENDRDSRVHQIDIAKLKSWLSQKMITNSEYKRFRKFLKFDCIGYYIEIENDLAAWGFVQTKGEYQYSNYIYTLPKNVHMLKNLYVKPKFRGLSLGKLINEARINSIPDSCIPCGFVIPENKYAIRNLKMFGFKEFIKIRHMFWFKTYIKTTIKIKKDSEITESLVKGFNNETKT